MFVGDGFTEGGFELFGYRKVVKDRELAGVLFYNTCAFRCYQAYIILDFMEYILVVYVDIFV